MSIQFLSHAVQFTAVKSSSSLPLFLLSLLCLSRLLLGLLVYGDELTSRSQGPEKLHDEREVIVSPSNGFNPPLGPFILLISKHHFNSGNLRSLCKEENKEREEKDSAMTGK